MIFNGKNLQELCKMAGSWPFEEARRVLHRSAKQNPLESKPTLFETGYGPSGLPHIGTFGEVVRTAMVQQAFTSLSGLPSRLICFSDDFDALRKVPANIPNPQKITPFLGFPLSQVPDPFNDYESFGYANNKRLQNFLDSFGFTYTFFSATEAYKKGIFDATLLRVLHHHAEIVAAITPTLGPERQATYSPFLPISPSTGRLLQVKIEEYNLDTGTIVFLGENSKYCEVPVTGGHCKLQWKVDWAVRWCALGVDYEMFGKDLVDTVRLSRKVCEILGYAPPEGFGYELFLDNEGKKISKSKGNDGISVEQWLAYAPPETLAFFMYHTPTKAKRLSFEVIPKCIDDYLVAWENFETQSPEAQVNNPLWFVHKGEVPTVSIKGLRFTLLMNLVATCGASDAETLWSYIRRYKPEAAPGVDPFWDKLVEGALLYYTRYIKPYRILRMPSLEERKAIAALLTFLESLEPEAYHDAEAFQFQAYEIGKAYNFDLKVWFQGLYEVLFGQSQGPRIGSFIALYGVLETIALLKERLE